MYIYTIPVITFLVLIEFYVHRFIVVILQIFVLLYLYS